jgi:hypothetical protein
LVIEFWGPDAGLELVADRITVDGDPIDSLGGSRDIHRR